MIAASVSTSTALVGSSRIRIGASFRKARASEIRWRSPAHAPFSNQRPVAVRQTYDEIVRVGELGGSNDLLLASSRPGICNIFCNIRGEQNGLLEHEGKLVPKVVELVVTDIDPVQQDLTAGHVVKPGQKADQRGFACTGSTYEADPGTGRNVELNVVKDRPVVLISERDVSKRDGTQGA